MLLGKILLERLSKSALSALPDRQMFVCTGADLQALHALLQLFIAAGALRKVLRGC